MTPRPAPATTAAAQLERLLQLVPWLVQNPGVSADDVATEFNVSTRQIECDLNLLIVCGLPGGQHGDLIDIQFWADEAQDDDGPVAADGAIRVLDPQTLDRPMALRRDEAVSLLVGLRLLQELPGGVDRDLIEGVIGKLQDVAGEAADPVATLRVESPTEEQSAVTRAVIDDALIQGRRLHISYLVPTRDEVTERVVEPQRVLLTQGHVYLRAWCLTAEAERTFRVDRILQAEVLHDPIDAARAQADDPVGGFFIGEPDLPLVTVDLQPAGRWIAEYAPVEATRELGGGALQIDLRVGDERWIERLVLQAGGMARVVAPREIADRLLERTRDALAAYR